MSQEALRPDRWRFLPRARPIGPSLPRTVRSARASSPSATENRHAHPDWFNGAVPSFGPGTARLLIVGLAPGLKGANRTGRPFLGDYAGELLYRTLLKVGLARGRHDLAAPDELELVDCMISNAVRCVPPQNKPKPEEIAHCRQFLIGRIAALPNLTSLLAIGRIAHDGILDALQLKRRDFSLPTAPGTSFLAGLSCSTAIIAPARTPIPDG